MRRSNVNTHRYDKRLLRLYNDKRQKWHALHRVTFVFVCVSTKRKLEKGLLPVNMILICWFHYEGYTDPENAIMREKQIKAGSRKKKLALIEKMNQGNDLAMILSDWIVATGLLRRRLSSSSQ